MTMGLPTRSTFRAARASSTCSAFGARHKAHSGEFAGRPIPGRLVLRDDRGEGGPCSRRASMVITKEVINRMAGVVVEAR